MDARDGSFPGYKKTLILHRREEELRHALHHGAPLSKLKKAAERVRIAKFHRIKALQSGLADRHPRDSLAVDQVAALTRESELWKRRSTDEILEHYRREKRLTKSMQRTALCVTSPCFHCVRLSATTHVSR